MRYIPVLITILILSCLPQKLKAQNKFPFGDIKLSELENKPYAPDPGADAIILSDIGIATLNYSGSAFYAELQRDVRIRIVNSNGFDYANIEEPFYTDDDLLKYQASTFNLRNGEKVETKIPKKNFILEKTTPSRKMLKFNFPDVHEGSVIEYSYTVRLKDNAVFILVPWEFQSDIPVIGSSITVAYPEYFVYKSVITGSSTLVNFRESASDSYFGREPVKLFAKTWYAQNMPAFKEEPFIKSKKEHLTKISFELASVNMPGSSYEEITPTYATLTKKLLEREDFGTALKRTAFLKKTTADLTKGLKDDMAKLKKIHQYVSTKILFNGIEDYTASSSLQSVFKKEKGNSADINMILIGMLRAANIKADPVILSTRSNGSINQYSAVVQQFNYLLACVNINGENYVVDATDPLRPFNVIPFECLNNSGRLINESESKFINLRNKEKTSGSTLLNLTLDKDGNVTGELEHGYSDYRAYNVRKLVKLESEEGYLDMIKSVASDMEISGFRLRNIDERDSDLIESFNIKISKGAQIAGDKILVNPFFNTRSAKNPFFEKERRFAVDFGCPVEELYSLIMKVPDGFSVIEKPENITFTIGKNEGKFEFQCFQNGNNLEISSVLRIDKTIFLPTEYTIIQDFYSKVLQKQAELIVMKKNPVIN
jgi:hypothetical protein